MGSRMRDHVALNITEAVEAAAVAAAKPNRMNWDTLDAPTKAYLREQVLPIVAAAAPYIIEAMRADILSRTYRID